MKAEIIARLKGIYNAFEPTDDEPEISMHELISRYNEQYENTELIGGPWVRQTVPEWADLP